MKQIQVSQGREILVDDEDFDALNQFTWCVQTAGYAITYVWHRNKRFVFLMHRLLSDAPNDMEVDHINGNKLDNRKANLRIASRAQNCWNRRPHRGTRSGVKGVTWSQSNRKWLSQITANGRHHYLGVYRDLDDARAAYNKAALRLHGEFARINPPGPMDA